MARYLGLWRMNPVAPWPTDPSDYLEQAEKLFAVLDDLMKKGEIEELCFFPDGNSGYAIYKGEATDMFRIASMFLPYILKEFHEIIPYEKSKEIVKAVVKAQVEAAKK